MTRMMRMPIRVIRVLLFGAYKIYVPLVIK